MRLKFISVLLFFATVITVALLLFPTRMDMVILYRNSYFYDTALERLDQLEAKQPQDRRIYLERARIFYLTGRYEQAVDILEWYTSTDPADPEGWRVLAQNYLVLQQRDRAAAAYERLLVSAPDDPEASDWLDIYYRLNQLGERRVENLEQMLASAPDNFYIHEKLIDLYMRMGRPDEARQAIERAARTFPDSAYVQEQLGQFYLSQRDVRALPIFTALHEESPDEEAYLSGLVNALVLARPNRSMPRCTAPIRTAPLSRCASPSSCWTPATWKPLAGTFCGPWNWPRTMSRRCSVWLPSPTSRIRPPPCPICRALSAAIRTTPRRSIAWDWCTRLWATPRAWSTITSGYWNGSRGCRGTTCSFCARKRTRGSAPVPFCRRVTCSTRPASSTRRPWNWPTTTPRSSSPRENTDAPWRC